jgi:ParB family chromosome partitioning protein
MKQARLRIRQTKSGRCEKVAEKEQQRAGIKLTSVDDLFVTEEGRQEAAREKVLELPLTEISDFREHPFKVKTDEVMLEMAESIRQYGELVPGLVRPKADGGYEMVAGHRRKKASELAGKDSIPCLVRELDQDQTTIIMVDSNLQREYVAPSEKAFAYKMKLEAMKRQAGRPCIENVSQLGTRKRSDQLLADQVGESRNQIQRYIHLTELVPAILEMVDQKRMAFSPAIEVSYLPEKEQLALLEKMHAEDCTPSLAQAQHMKKLSQSGNLNPDVIAAIMEEEKPTQKEKLFIPRERIEGLLPREFTEKQLEDLLVQLLKEWSRKRKREHER